MTIEMVPLTEKESRFADRYGYLLNEMLEKCSLPMEDCFDSIALAFMRAVKSYFAQDDLQTYGFEKIVRSILESKIKMLKKENKPKACSFRSAVRTMQNSAAPLYYQRSIDPEQEIEKKQTLEAIYSLITEDERDMLIMYSSGSSDAEIASHFGLDPSSVGNKIKNIKRYIINNLPRSLVEELGHERA